MTRSLDGEKILAARIGVDLPVLVEWMAAEQYGQLGGDICANDDCIANADSSFHVIESLTVGKSVDWPQTRCIVLELTSVVDRI